MNNSAKYGNCIKFIMFRKNTFKLAKENLENANKPEALKKLKSVVKDPAL